MGNYNYSNFFRKFPKIYSDFSSIVGHARNFRQEMESKGLLKKGLSILSIGPGEGELELKAAKEFSSHFALVEPELSYIKKMKGILDKDSELNGRVELFPSSFQEFQIQKSFDLILSIHSWYAIGKDLTQTRKAIEFLGKNSKLFITLVAPDNPVKEIAALTSDNSGSGFNSLELSNWLNEQGIKHQYWDNINRIPKSKVQIGEQLTDDGRALVSFPAFTPWEEMTDGVQSKVMTILSNRSEGDDLILKNGCILIER